MQPWKIFDNKYFKMFNKSPEDRLSAWCEFRHQLDTINEPLNSLAGLWARAPLIIHHHKIDPYNPKSWPTPWEILHENKYDDFTIALMIGYTLKLTNKFNNALIEVRTMVNPSKTKLYNLVYVDNTSVLNYNQAQVVGVENIDESLYLENIVNIVFPR